jgi:hypothetical protein
MRQLKGDVFTLRDVIKACVATVAMAMGGVYMNSMGELGSWRDVLGGIFWMVAAAAAGVVIVVGGTVGVASGTEASRRDSNIKL